MTHGKVYEVPNLRILETEFGLSATNRAGEVFFGTPTALMSVRSGEFRKGRLPNPAEAAEMWPTPRANSGNGAAKHGDGGPDLQTAVVLAEEKLWPTPDTRGFTNKGSLKMLAEKAENPGEFSGMAYRQGAEKKEKLWGTPTANDAKNSLTGSQAGRGTLTAQIVESLWPTPRTAGMCGGTGNWERLKEKCASIGEVRQMGAGNGGQLNPDWVEALMGYPQGWTDIDKEDSELRDQMYPATWRDGTWEKGIPRVVCESKNRTKRLKGLGNAVVPQIPAVLWAMIARAL